MREETQALGAYCFKKEVLSSDTESSPWDRGACEEVTLVPSDRGSLDSGRELQWNPDVSRVALGCLPTFLAHTPCAPRSARQLLPQAPLLLLLWDTWEPLFYARPHHSAVVVFTLPQGRGLSYYSYFTGEDTEARSRSELVHSHLTGRQRSWDLNQALWLWQSPKGGLGVSEE